jgi:recombination DNA repair RAD52 pathway protein
MAYGLTPEQYRYLMNPLRSTRVAKRRQGGKELSYLEAWDIKAHLTRIFGFGNWDSEMLEYRHVTDRPYINQNNNNEMVEVIYTCRVRLTIRDAEGSMLCEHTEAAAGSASGPMSMLGDHHDNALKSAASDALKRCAINLGTQFGLSLYDNGNTGDVIRQTLVKPAGVEDAKPEVTETQEAMLAQSLGATPVDEPAAEESEG